MRISDILEDASTDELFDLMELIPEEIKLRKLSEIKEIKNKIISKSEEVNVLGRRIYTNKEIALMFAVKPYYVAEVLKEYNNLDDKYTETKGDNNDTE